MPTTWKKPTFTELAVGGECTAYAGAAPPAKSPNVPPDRIAGLPRRKCRAKNPIVRPPDIKSERAKLMNAGARDLREDESFLAHLRSVGKHGYHAKHPFHLRMNRGELSAGEVRKWVANRFAYQQIIPRKDAAILTNCPVREVRASWARRLADHDGSPEGERRGGIESWLLLAEACGLDRNETLAGRHVAAGARFAAGAYLDFAKTAPWPVAIASSLTELFAPDLMRAQDRGVSRPLLLGSRMGARVL